MVSTFELSNDGKGRKRQKAKVTRQPQTVSAGAGLQNQTHKILQTEQPARPQRGALRDKAAAPKKAAANTAPEEVIPLKDGDFKEF